MQRGRGGIFRTFYLCMIFFFFPFFTLRGRKLYIKGWMDGKDERKRPIDETTSNKDTQFTLYITIYHPIAFIRLLPYPLSNLPPSASSSTTTPPSHLHHNPLATPSLKHHHPSSTRYTTAQTHNLAPYSYPLSKICISDSRTCPTSTPHTMIQ